MVVLVTMILKSYVAIFSITKYKFIVRLVDSKLNNLALQLQYSLTVAHR